MNATKSTNDKIDEVFLVCCGSNGYADLRSIIKTFWYVLNNSVSIVDITGVFALIKPSNDQEINASGSVEALDSVLFVEFFNGIARLKYSSGTDYVDKLLDDFRSSKSMKPLSDALPYSLIFDKSVVKVLLKYDIPLRKAFSAFAGHNIKLGGGLTWNEIKNQSIGMELDGLVSFAASYSLIPSRFSNFQCEALTKDVMAKWPLLQSMPALQSTILFPQFQLLLAVMSLDHHKRSEAPGARDAKDSRKLILDDSKPLCDILSKFCEDIGIAKRVRRADMAAYPLGASTAEQTASCTAMPSSLRPEDHYATAGSHSRQAMLIRLDHLFADIEGKLLELVGPVDFGSMAVDDDSCRRLTVKPVVIGDAVPVPVSCPDMVEQLLQAALAHHNLGSFEESLKFLEAARLQLVEVERRSRAVLKRQESAGAAEGEELSAAADRDANTAGLPLDLDLYITLCKGNVYQSCGDDEQSLLHYLEGWARAIERKDKDWEIVCMNSIGMLAFYSLRYDIAFMCFTVVARYREKNYGMESVDTASSWNNEGCCQFCLQKKGEARLKFEKAWNIICKVLGHRSPRAVAVWKNLEKARRAHAPMQTKAAIMESVVLRPDADRLLVGSFVIKAIGPPDLNKKKKKKSSKGKGGKKKKK